MGFYQGNDLRKISGGLKRKHRKPRKHEIGSYPTETRLSQADVRVIERVYGGNTKIRLKYVAFANVYNPNTKQYTKTRILGVVETPANRELARRGIIVKGAIINTEVGKAKVISRPSQDGVVNAVLIEEAKKS
ncbi:30S ribosomal protein S8e [Ignisphaera sp. 4213-co]|uniref:Small ribosomal subunit protein eS8 n=1 Tax=Ignisphaera cupida TaxID=3050454 RepID=A0ABD4Z3S4_9CREN|nr:30S ribosomal protein S8e [Ignisphaera sp. 4213-co]MDK6027854.1 30S ribosomal protein S8e [Ignisphaera sp. 4213-co]